MPIERDAKELYGLRKEAHDAERRLTQDLLAAKGPDERMAAVDQRDAEKDAARREAEDCAGQFIQREEG